MQADWHRDRSTKKRKPKGMTWADAAKIVRKSIALNAISSVRMFFHGVLRNVDPVYYVVSG